MSTLHALDTSYQAGQLSTTRYAFELGKRWQEARTNIEKVHILKRLRQLEPKEVQS